MSDTSTGIPWDKVALGGASLALPFLFGGGNQGEDVTKQIGDVNSAAKGNLANGDQIQAQGSEALAPVLSYLSKLTSGDTATTLQAVQPQVNSVLAQYDTARKATAQFSPRGGGSNAAEATSRNQQGSDIASIIANARTNAVDKAGTIGTSLTQIGATQKAQAVQTMASTIYPLLEQEKQNQQGFDAFFSGLAKMIGPLLFGAAA